MSAPSCSIPPSLRGLSQRCIQPPPGNAFSAALATHPIASKSEPVAAPPPLRDDLLDNPFRISTGKVATLFLSGLTLSMGGGLALRSLLRPASVVEQNLSTALPQTLSAMAGGDEKKSVFFYWRKPLFSLLAWSMEKQDAHKPLLGFIGSAISGYLLSAMAQGAQESWTRNKETEIRAELLTQVKDVFRQSYHLKNQADQELQQTASRRIQDLLRSYNLSLPELSTGLGSPDDVDRQYVFFPTHRTRREGVAFGSGKSPLATESPPSLTDSLTRTTGLTRMEWASFGAGALTGTVAQGAMALLHRAGGVAKKYEKEIMISFDDMETAFVQRNVPIIIAGTLLGAGAALGKLLIDAVREVEVTRLNAATEYRYQKHNWLTLDPGYHQAAEEAALDDAIQRLADDLRTSAVLRTDKALLKRRVEDILLNVGRNSPPKYFPATPSVMLTLAKG